MLKAEAKPERAESPRRGRADKPATERRRRALQADRMLSGGGAAGEFEPGGGGDVSHAADVDGATQGARGGAWGFAIREDESGDAAHGGGQGVLALCREDRGRFRRREAPVGGVPGGIWGKAPDRGFAWSGDLRVARVIGEVRGGVSEGFDLRKDGTFRGESGDDAQRRRTARSHAGDAPPRDREPTPL